MAILVGIDGTGASSDEEYTSDFERSFVNQIVNGSRIAQANKRYFRGPIGPGGGMPESIDGGFNFIRQKRMAGDTGPILLTGFSRGGLGVIVVAKRLKRQNIPVAAMLLFDAVDRHLAYDGSEIPNNVAHVLHLRRSPAARSRMSFNNDGTDWTPPTVYREEFFMCTHGAVGGTHWVPKGDQKITDYVDEGYGEGALNWGLIGGIFYRTNVTFAQDASESQKVWAAAQPFLMRHGFR